MEPAEDLRPVYLPDGVVELRIHGVSGTPPELLLKATPIRVAGSPKSGFYRTRVGETAQGLIEAYSWGGLTSGSRASALWLLLLPFALVNVGGWMLPTIKRGRDEAFWTKTLVLFGRLVAVGLTMMLAAALFIVSSTALGQSLPWSEGPFGAVADAWSAISTEPRVSLAATAVLASIALGLFQLIALIGSRRNTGQRLRETLELAAAPTPFGGLWGGASFVRFLGLTHLGAAWGGVAVITAIAVDDRGHGWSGLATFGGFLAIFLALLTLVFISFESTAVADWLETVTWVVGAVAVLGAALVALHSDPGAGSQPESADPASLTEAVAAGGFTTVVIFIVVLVGAMLATHLFAGDEGRFNSVAFVAWGFAAAASAASGLLIVLDPEPRPSVDLAAWVFAVAGLLAIVLFLWTWNPLEGPPVDRATRLRDAVVHGVAIVRWTGMALAVAIAVGLVWFVRTATKRWFVDGQLPDPNSEWGGAVGLLLVLAVLVALIRPVWKVAMVVLAVAAGLTWLVVGPLGDIYGSDVALTLDLTAVGETFIDYAGYAGMVAPLIATFWFVLRASGRRSNRRAVGVFWDLANFWPRWSHPWAPAPYNEVALPALQDRIDVLVGEGKTVVVSGHSQGAVMAVPILHAAGAELDLRFLSYGCLIDRHYRQLFPRFFNESVLGTVDANVDRRWINLHRVTDPLGHRVEMLQTRSVEASHTEPELRLDLLTHSDYQYSEQYQESLDRLLGDLGGGSGDDEAPKQ